MMNFIGKIILYTFVSALIFDSCAAYAGTKAEIPLRSPSKYPDYSYEYLGRDKFEGFNRKIFSFNRKFNKYALRPVHILWASIMPKYGMDRIQSVYTNIEYPKRLVSTLLQRDFKATGHETLRFITNTTLGLGGMFDPAERFFKLEPLHEDVAQGLCKCKMKHGPYLVMPFINSTCPAALLGSLIECPLDVSMYIGSPITAAVKAGLLVNRTSYAQPVIKMIESNFADPYDITKKMYGLERYIKNNNYDRKEILELALKECAQCAKEAEVANALNIGDNKSTDEKAKLDPEAKLVVNDTIKGYTWFDNFDNKSLELTNQPLIPDIILKNFNPQCPVTDAMRTALFEEEEKYKSIWSEMSLWHRCFSKKIKTSSVDTDNGADKYKFKYILQKGNSSPLVILYPSIGEGITSHHSLVFAKMFYDKGYSVIIQGSHFHWEFLKSMPKGHMPGMPARDVAQLRSLSAKIIRQLEDKYNYTFSDRVVLGTSFGAFATLFLADMESRENILNITKYISINPPVELLYAVDVIDKNNDMWDKNPVDIKKRTALAASKIIQMANRKNDKDFVIDSLPFSSDEARLITCFVLRQKLSDLIYTIENVKPSKKSDIYAKINNISYFDYVKEHMLEPDNETLEDLNRKTSLYSISNYLKNNRNYKIYHAMDDYLVNDKQLKDLREFAGSNLVLFDRGSHLGFLYRQEFKDVLYRDIEPQKQAQKAPVVAE